MGTLLVQILILLFLLINFQSNKVHVRDREPLLGTISYFWRENIVIQVRILEKT